MSTGRALRPFLIAILVIAAFFVGAFFGNRSESVGGFADDLFGSEDAALSQQAFEVIQDKYFEDVNGEVLDDASVGGMVRELRRRYKDRFSHYFDPKAYALFRESTSGRFSGVGLTVSEVPRGLRVSGVIEDSPAQRAGILEGDFVTAVNGKSIAGTDSNISVARIKGDPGTKVTLTVERPSNGSKKDYELTREELSAPVVEGEMKQVEGRKVGYVRLSAFSTGAPAQLREEVERLEEQGAEGIVLDLRGNGGGLLDEAVLTASNFVEDGVIVSTEGRSQPKQVFEAVGDALPETPMVVLINGDTASASEILTAALEQAGLATIVGERSYGKGVFQEVINLDNGGALDLTVGEYLTRDGTSINHVGIKPEVPARDRPATRVDEGLQQALQTLGADLDGSAPAQQK